MQHTRCCNVLTAACWPEPLPIHREACPINNVAATFAMSGGKSRGVRTQHRPWTKSWPSILQFCRFLLCNFLLSLCCQRFAFASDCPPPKLKAKQSKLQAIARRHGTPLPRQARRVLPEGQGGRIPGPVGLQAPPARRGVRHLRHPEQGGGGGRW